MYSTHNEWKYVVAERFIRTLWINLSKYTTSVSKNVYIDKIDGILNKYNNIYPSTIKMKHTYFHIFSLVTKFMKKILISKLVILLEYQNIKTVLQKVTIGIGLTKFL